MIGSAVSIPLPVLVVVRIPANLFAFTSSMSFVDGAILSSQLPKTWNTLVNTNTDLNPKPQ